MNAKAAVLTSDILSKKGEASPATPAQPEPAAEPASTITVEPRKPPAGKGRVAKPAPEPADKPPPVTGQAYHKALTLKLDHGRYLALKRAGLDMGKTSQTILIEALDLWLEQLVQQ